MVPVTVETGEGGKGGGDNHGVVPRLMEALYHPLSLLYLTTQESANLSPERCAAGYRKPNLLPCWLEICSHHTGLRFSPIF